MSATDSQDLLRAYVQEHSEAAFKELVRRYVDLVYSVAAHQRALQRLEAQGFDFGRHFR
jgi:hypothetical protein